MSAGSTGGCGNALSMNTIPMTVISGSSSNMRATSIDTSPPNDQPISYISQCHVVIPILPRDMGVLTTKQHFSLRDNRLDQSGILLSHGRYTFPWLFCHHVAVINTPNSSLKRTEREIWEDGSTAVMKENQRSSCPCSRTDLDEGWVCAVHFYFLSKNNAACRLDRDDELDAR